MNFGQWLDAERGRQSRIAEHFDVSLSAVSQWRTNGVPRDRILDVHNFTERAVSVEELLQPGAMKTADADLAAETLLRNGAVAVVRS